MMWLISGTAALHVLIKPLNASRAVVQCSTPHFPRWRDQLKLLCGGSRSGCSGFAMQQDKQQQGRGRSRTNTEGGEEEARTEKTKQRKDRIIQWREERGDTLQKAADLSVSTLGWVGAEVIASIDFTLVLRFDLHCMPRHLILICCVSLSISSSYHRRHWKWLMWDVWLLKLT